MDIEAPLTARRKEDQSTASLPVYTCSLCGKEYDTRRSQVRHLSYCKKSRSRPKSRKKACTICTQAKTQCDTNFPRCTRCASKNLVCAYDKPSRIGVSHTSLPGDQDERSSSASDTLCQAQDDSDNYFPILDFEDPGHIASPSPTTHGRWEIKTNDVTSSTLTLEDNSSSMQQARKSPFAIDPLAAMMDSESYGYLPTEDISTSFISDNLGSFLPGSRPFTGAPILSSNLPSPHQIMLKPPKAFWPRRARHSQLSLHRRFVISQLRSYPEMMLPGANLPPFIHPLSLTSPSGDILVHKSMPNPLAICAGIVQMFSAKNKSNCRFCWKTVRMEQERLAAECVVYNELNTVAALQAITVYMLLRLSENDEDATDFDIPLIETMMKLAYRASKFPLIFKEAPSDAKITWEQWVLAESLRRTFIVTFLVNLLFDISVGIQVECDGTQFAAMMLPSSRSVWEASTRSEWERGFGKYLAGLDANRQLTYGDLLAFNFHIGSVDSHRLDTWLSQVDNFGALVTAAASLPDGQFFSS